MGESPRGSEEGELEEREQRVGNSPPGGSPEAHQQLLLLLLLLLLEEGSPGLGLASESLEAHRHQHCLLLADWQPV